MEVEESVVNEKTDNVQISLNNNEKPPVISPDIHMLKECSTKSESHREVDSVPCFMCTNVNTAPMINCKILNKNQSGCIDTAAVITVIPRTRDLPVAKLRLKGVTSHKANLYGPAMTEFEIGGKIFKHETYEADIQEHILGIDFLHKFDAVIGVKRQVLEIGEGPNRVEVPFTLGETKNVNIYTTDRVAYTVRAESSFTLRPFVEREVATVLRTDAVADESVRGRTDACQSSGHTQGLDLGEGGHTQSRVVLNTQVVGQAVVSDSEGNEIKGSLNENSQLPGETKLGLFVSNPAFGNKVSKLPPGVVAQSGIIPCLTAPISITIQNLGDKCVTIPKYAVLGEVFILHPDKYEKEFDEDFKDDGEYDEEEEIENMDVDIDMDEIAQVNVVNHETTPFSDAEINTVPSLPEIKEGAPLPKDLQELIDRCTQLSETEKQELDKLLRKHHDIFAKDNTTFGKCPWIKFRIDTAHGYHNLEIHPDDQPKTAIILPEGLGLAHRQFEFTRLSFGLAAAPGAFQYITDRVITPAKEKTPENDLERKMIKLTNDTITVNWTTVVPDGMSPMDIRKAQLLDPDIMPIMIAVQDQKKPEFQEIIEHSNKTRSLWFQFNSLVIEGGVLYRKFEHPSGLKEKEELQLILPTKLVKPTIKTYHEQLGVGNHFGVTKTLAYLKRFFWWPGMFEDTYEVVSQCSICAKYKGPKHHTKVPLKLFQEGVLHGRWHVDICGPINPKSKEGYEYILVAFSPYEVMFGAAMRSPLDADRGSPPKNTEMNKLYPMWVRKTMQDIHEVVADMNKKAAKRMKAYYDRNATLSPFAEGDLVYLYYPRRVTGISAKLTTRWEGPYRIVNLINECNARIERVDNPTKKLIVHIDRLARCPEEVTNVNKADDMKNAWLLFVE
ncbi:Transposon Ty3-G Gag-Pol polyprotein [Frankliniella fusca]|uniref:RNA-directed DNA polymerase n=1 Tax=Frankliniella fusca TaxID=407009 RepID=A0AAE1LWY5_9NEOP|nr:Transposon Ty3-G Gag-Pol polyprotein [Frankliniella fusca]